MRLASVSAYAENSIRYRHNKQKITFDKWLYMVKSMKLVIAIFALFSTWLFEEKTPNPYPIAKNTQKFRFSSIRSIEPFAVEFVARQMAR